MVSIYANLPETMIIVKIVILGLAPVAQVDRAAVS